MHRSDHCFSTDDGWEGKVMKEEGYTWSKTKVSDRSWTMFIVTYPLLLLLLIIIIILITYGRTCVSVMTASPGIWLPNTKLPKNRPGAARKEKRKERKWKEIKIVAKRSGEENRPGATHRKKSRRLQRRTRGGGGGGGGGGGRAGGEEDGEGEWEDEEEEEFTQPAKHTNTPTCKPQALLRFRRGDRSKCNEHTVAKITWQRQQQAYPCTHDEGAQRKKGGKERRKKKRKE